MAIIKTFNGLAPVIGENCFLAETSTLIGNVVVGNNCSIWYSAVLRGDLHYIKIGNGVNIQDNVTVHVTTDTGPVEIGDYCTIGHNCVIHGCKIENNVLIGMGAVVLDGAIIKENSIVAAGSVVLSGTVVESGCIYGGIPAKKVKQMDIEKIRNMIRNNGDAYIDLARQYMLK